MKPGLRELLIAGLESYPQGAPKVGIQQYAGMGAGIMAEQDVKIGTFIMPYAGDLISPEEHAIRSRMYEEEGAGSYCVELERPYKNKRWVVDATKHYGCVQTVKMHAC